MLSRRGFLASALGAGVSALARAQAAEASPKILRIERRVIDVNGKPASVFGVSQPDGIFGLATEVGAPFRVRVENHIDEPSLLHWHGLTPPWRQDGVAGISAPPIPPGGAAEYDFPLPFGGAYWMHSHFGLQEQLLLSAPLIIRSRNNATKAREIVLMLADFSFTPPQQIFENLRKGANASGMGKAMNMAETGQMNKTIVEPAAMPGLPSTGNTPPQPDLNDVVYDAFLANDRTLADPEVVSLEPGEEVLLRIINASSMSAYHIDLGRIEGELIAVDGHGILPVKGRRFPITVAQRLDVRFLLPKDVGAYPVLALLEGARRRSGLILRAGRSHVEKIAELSDAAAPALTLELESRLQATEPLRPRKTDRVHVLNLTGAMQHYQWSINDVVWSEATPPLPVSAGERVELLFVNRTPMPHPMHLHGHTFQVVAIDGERFAGAVRDTVLVPPKTSVAVAFDADNPGWWALHCHLLYHMDAGMFTTIRYV